jgi:capsular exopolysaccharide synthesis family protein
LDLAQYLRIFRARAPLIAASTIICCAVAAGVAWTRAPVYEAQTELFVTTRAKSSQSPSESYAGTLLAQQRVASYAQLLTSRAILRQVAKDVDSTPVDLGPEISVSNPPGTTLVDVSVRDHSPLRAKLIADSIGRHFPAFVSNLESPSTGAGAPIKVTVTNPAELPISPVSARKKLALILGATLGLILGIGLAVVGEALDRRVRDAADTFEITGVSRVTSIPRHRGARDKPLVMAAAPLSRSAEAIRQLRTNLQSQLDPRSTGVIVVAGPCEHDGKSFVAANLALAFAQTGRQVCLLDADLRRRKPGGVTAMFDATGAPGLADVLVRSTEIEQVLRSWSDRLEVVPTGQAHPASSGELLDSLVFGDTVAAIAATVELIVIDTPSLLSYADAAAVAKHATGVVLVARAGSTRRDELGRAVEAMRNIDVPVLCTVVNGAPRDGTSVYRAGASGYSPDENGALADRDVAAKPARRLPGGSDTGQ